MNFRKKFLIIGSLLLSLQPVSAEVLVVEEQNGDIQYYDLGDKPVITYSGAKLLVNSTKASAEFSIPEVAKYYFRKEVTVSKLVNDGDKPVIWVTDNVLSFRNTKANQDVQLYNSNGQLTGMYKTDANGTLDIDLSQNGKGILLVKTHLTTIKIAR